jgi:flagella basal body P-ring formation protein FlgA
MRRLAASLAWLVAALALVQAGSAAAGTPVALRGDLSSGPTITLGDLFQGAGRAGSAFVGNGAPAGLDAVLDAGAVQRIAALNGLDWANPNGIRRIIVRGVTLADAAPERANDAQMAQALTYSRSLAAGAIVRPDDLTFAPVPAFALPADAPHDASQIIGKLTRQPLKAGAAAELRDVSNPQVIKPNDLVQVAYHADGITLVLQAKALGPAGVGDVISIMNTSSNKVIQAVAVGPDQAVVGPEAVEMRAAASANPTQFADNR